VVAPSLLELARFVDTVDLVVGNDSGVLHLAAARRRPVVAIFGSTVPELGFEPFRTPHCVVQYPLPCRPCTAIGRERCPLGHLRCLRALEPHHVLHAVDVLRKWLATGAYAPWGPTLGSGARLRT
jgi:heptosyltransferase-2